MTRDELRVAQWRGLSAGLERLTHLNRFYQAKVASAGIGPSDVRSLGDLQKLPYTTKEEILADQDSTPPYGSNLTAPLGDYARLHQSSGTSGRRLRWLDTPQGWQWILDCWELIYRAVGASRADRFFFPFSFGPFLGFWAAFEGASRLGYFTLAGGGLSTVARLRLMLDNAITFVLCTPTYALRMAEVARTEKIDLKDAPVRALVLAGEPGASIPATRERIEQAWGARVFDHSGMTEIGSLGVEFVAFPGKLFLLENHAIAEFIDPKTAALVPEGEVGELVLTNLGRWDSPLLRYRTGDLVRWRADVAPPDLPFVYLDGGILGRTDDMLWIKGNNVYPSAIEAVVRRFSEVCEFAIEVEQAATAPRLKIRIEPFSAETGTESLAAAVADAIHDRYYFHPTVEIAAPGSLPRFEMKARRFVRRS